MKGVLALVTSSVFFAIMAALVRQAQSIDSFTKAFYRFAIGMGILGLAAMLKQTRLEFQRSGLLLQRGVYGAISIALSIVSIDHNGLAKGTVLSSTYPIFAALAAWLLLKEKVRPQQWGCILLAMAGVYLISVGGVGVGWTFDRFELLAILGAVFGGVAVATIKQLHQTESSVAIYWAQCLVGFWFVVWPAGHAGTTPGWTGIVLLVLIGVFATLGQLLMTWAFKFVNVSTGSLLGLLTPVLNVAVGILFFSEPMGTLGLAGAALVLAACALMLRLRDRTGAAQ